MTTRDGGTGLGLPIVAKIFEDHGGRIELLDAPVDPAHPYAAPGARVRILFPAMMSDGATQPDAQPLAPVLHSANLPKHSEPKDHT
jgi:two-component system, NtrC family, nitrogen regulation sensor histidine kinase NtrY